MERKVTFFFYILFVFAMGCDMDTNKGEIKLVTPEEMHSLVEQKDVQLVDVRSSSEYQDGHIAFAQNIDFNSPTFDEDILKLDKSKPVILYCKSGGRSARCSKKLLAAGFIKIYELKGGITQWRYKGFGIESK